MTEELTNLLNSAYDKAYNKAIDDFVCTAYRMLGTSDKELYCVDIVDKIAKQLKMEIKG